MRRYYQVASLGFLALGIFTVLESRNFEYYTPTGPGPGFFPFWLGLSLSLLSTMWLGQSTLRPVRPLPEDFFPEREGAIKVVSAVGALVVAAFAVDIIGFQLTAFAFLMFMIWGVARRSLPLSLVLSLLGSVGVNYAFNQWLDVPLPTSSIEFLENLGL